MCKGRLLLVFVSRVSAFFAAAPIGTASASTAIIASMIGEVSELKGLDFLKESLHL